MTQPRLKAGIWVRAQIAQCQAQLITAMISHMGHEDAGAVLLKLNRFDRGCSVYSRVTTLDGEIAWMLVAGGTIGDGGANTNANANANVNANVNALGPREIEFACDEYCRRQTSFDRDIWVLEIEDHQGKYELDAPVSEF